MVETATVDEKFLVKLHKKLHNPIKVRTNYHKGRYCPGGGQIIDSEEYSDEKMIPSEIECVLKIIQEQKLVFTPMNCCMGLSVGFKVSRIDNHTIGVPAEISDLLDFKEDQLPKGYDFNRLSQVFGSAANKQLLEYAGLDPIKDRVHYEY